MTYTPNAPQHDAAEGHTTYFDAEEAGMRMHVATGGDTDLADFTIGREGHGHEMFALSARDRVALAMQLLDGVPGIELGTAVQNPAKYQVIVDTHTTFGDATPAGLDKLLQRLAWHLRQGIPAKVIEPEGGMFTVNEVSEGEVPPRMSETRRHFRYQLPGSDEWHYHGNFKKITSDGGRNVQFQRTYKSDWEDV